MADEKIILEVQIDNEAARKSSIELNKQLILQKEALKELRKSTDATEKATEEYARAELDLKNEVAETSKQLRLNNNIQKANKDSKAALKAETNKLVAAADKLNLSNKEERKQFDALNKKIKENRDTLKEYDAAQGSFVRNVGNYTNGIIEAAQASGGFGAAQGQAAQGLGILKTGLKGATLGFKGLKGAIVATGIGALVIALTAVFTALTKTRKGAQLLEKGLGVVGGVTTALIDGFATFGQSIIDVANGTASLTDVFSNFLSIFDPTRLAEGAVAGLEAADSNIKLREETRKLTVEISKQQAAAEGFRKLRDDETKSLQDRLKANDQVLEAERARTSAQLKLTGLRLQAIENERKLSGELNDEQLQEQAELQAELLDIQEDFNGRTTEQLTERNSLIRDANLQRVQAQKDTIDALVAQQTEGNAESLRLQKVALQAERDLQLQQAENEITSATALNARKLLIESEYQASLKEVKEQENELFLTLERQRFDEINKNADELIAQNLIRGQKEIQNINTAFAAKKEISEKERELNNQNLEAAKSFFTAGEQLTKEGTALNKVFGIANATISTYQAGAQALATVPFPANIAALAAVIGTGLAQVAQIAGVGFESGGSLASAGGTEGTQQSGITDNLLGSAPGLPLFRFGGQEYIVNKKATLNNMQALQTINSMGANTKFSVLPQFQTGGIVESNISAEVASQSAIRNALVNQPQPVVTVADISKGFSNVNVSETGGTFG